jgi:hypothetical protein
MYRYDWFINDENGNIAEEFQDIKLNRRKLSENS